MKPLGISIQADILQYAFTFKYLEGNRVVFVAFSGNFIPIGLTEQHGPNGLIGTDAICPTAITSHAGMKVYLLVGPALAQGPAQFNLKFPGTISLRPYTLMRLLEDYVLSLVCQVFQRFYLLNAHGGNLAPVHAAFQEIYTQHSLREHESLAPRCRLRS